MRDFITLILLTLLIFSCNDTRQKNAELTDTIYQSVSNTKQRSPTKNADTNRMIKRKFRLDSLHGISTNKMILVSSGQLSPYRIVNFNGYSFDLATNENDTIYLATKDKRFQTPEGYKVGTKFLELPKDIQSELTKELGWGYYYLLSSGWAIGFCEGSSCTDNYPKKYSKVKWIFKRK